MTQLESELLKLVATLQKELEDAQKNQLKVFEDGNRVIITYKDKIIFKANPEQK